MKIARSFVTLCVALGLAVSATRDASAVLGQRPQQTTSPAPAGATARCRDGTYSFSKHRSGTCSHHGGVATWLDSGRTLSPTASDTPGQVPGGGSPACGGHCGVERWAVKTLSDPDRERVQLRPVDTTIEALVALPRPVVLSAFARADPVEVTVYRVEARLLWLFTEADRDYHLVLASPRDTTITMIAEVPDPGCAGSVCFRLRWSLCTGTPEALRLFELAAERGAAARADHRCWVLRLRPRTARRRAEWDRTTPGARRGLPLGRRSPL
jgi:hypothetical protein